MPCIQILFFLCSARKGWMNPPLRFHDEPCRHKVLDLIGDLSLFARSGSQGLPVAHIMTYKVWKLFPSVELYFILFYFQIFFIKVVFLSLTPFFLSFFFFWWMPRPVWLCVFLHEKQKQKIKNKLLLFLYCLH